MDTNCKEQSETLSSDALCDVDWNIDRVCYFLGKYAENDPHDVVMILPLQIALALVLP